ncbi:hypothetical protein [Cohaesibacter gelatinilyticus]|uniref:Uncharacterized protein n=1 Tax=Cohaesibacter gelatinilyticus TaxID=372072 RepID=A0A285PHV3_9HYPH|nr:hypothetical protein [Cohaesibacter gelatinilyticus]SNZ20853.1 hypothetical protein SAMN06265368_3964 [Cohaesibacter gelatinilyticus]
MTEQENHDTREQTVLPCSFGDKTALLEWSILPILVSFVIMAATI